MRAIFTYAMFSNATARKALGSGVRLLGAAASCYLGLQASRLLWNASDFLLVAVSDAELTGAYRPAHGALVWFGFLPPSQGSQWIFALHSAGAVICALVFFVIAWVFLPKTNGWLRLLGTMTVFWLGILLADSAAAFAGSGWGGMAGALRVVGMGDLGIPGFRWLLSAIVLTGIIAVLFHAFALLAGASGESWRSRAAPLLLWLVLPVVLLDVFLPGIQMQTPWLQRAGFPYVPALTALVLLACIAARKPDRRAPWREPGLASVVAATLCAGLAVAGAVAYPAWLQKERRPELETHASRHWQLWFEKGAFTAEERTRWGGAADQRLEKLANRLDVPLPSSKLNAYVYRSAAKKRAATGETRDDAPFTLDLEQRAIHHLLSPDGAMMDPRGEALSLLGAQWGAPASERLALAIARYASGEFHGHGLVDYARRIACEEQAYELREILKSESPYLSPLVRDALGGAWVSLLVDQRGPGILKALYGTKLEDNDNARPAGLVGTAWEAIEREWLTRLRAEQIPCEREAGSASAAARIFQRGISFSHEIGGDFGYGSDAAQIELEKIRNLGANTIAIIPYAFTRAPHETSIRFRVDETDARLVRGILQAKQLGLRVALKPQLWAGQFTGNIAFERQQDFQVWFSQYRRWLRHHARLAELFGVDTLVIGTELGGVTTFTEAWVDLIRDLRRIYSGELTYAAHWDKEFERVAFWDALDYVGVNFYFPLAKGDDPQAVAPARLERITAALESLSRRHNKPILFTEVGFPAMATAAVEPWAENSVQLDTALQRRCYEAVFESFSRRPWLAGMYWWKWPTHGRGGPFDSSHSPIGKPALEVLQNWYQRPELRRERAASLSD